LSGDNYEEYRGSVLFTLNTHALKTSSIFLSALLYDSSTYRLGLARTYRKVT